MSTAASDHLSVLVATDDGVLEVALGDGTPRVRSLPLAGRRVTSLAEAGGLIVAGTRDGVAVSDDGGASWEAADDGLELRLVRWLEVVGDAGRPRVLAGTEPAGIFSAGPGERWQGAPEIAELRDEHGWFLPYSPEAGCVRGFAAHGERVYAAVEVGGLLRSDDAGRHWRLAGGSDGEPRFGEPPAGRIHPDVHSVAVHPSSPELVFAATAGGVFASDDGGETFRRLGPVQYCRALLVDAADPDHLLVGAANRVSDKQGRIERSRDGGRTWTRDSGAEGPWATAMVERFVRAPWGLLAIRSDGALLVRRDEDAAWRDVPLAGVHARAALARA